MDVEELWAAAPTPPWRDHNGELIPIDVPALAASQPSEAGEADRGAGRVSADAWPAWPVS